MDRVNLYSRIGDYCFNISVALLLAVFAECLTKPSVQINVYIILYCALACILFFVLAIFFTRKEAHYGACNSGNSDLRSAFDYFDGNPAVYRQKGY